MHSCVDGSICFNPSKSFVWKDDHAKVYCILWNVFFWCLYVKCTLFYDFCMLWLTCWVKGRTPGEKRRGDVEKCLRAFVTKIYIFESLTLSLFPACISDWNTRIPNKYLDAEDFAVLEVLQNIQSVRDGLPGRELISSYTWVKVGLLFDGLRYCLMG